MYRFCATFLIFGIVVSMCFADDEEEATGDDKNKFEDTVGDSMKGLGDWFKNAAEGTKGRAESGVETMKELSEQAREKSQAGLGAAKGFAEGVGDRFNKAKESLEESAEKMKEAFTSAAEKSKDEFQSASSKISKHAKEASDSMFGLLQFK